MAVFIIAGTDTGKMEVYPKEKDLRNLLFYCYNHSSATVMGNLYDLGMECIYQQFLYLQWRRIKRLNTRALHYILSFDTGRWEGDLGDSEILSIMYCLNGSLFEEYQHILFYHKDKPTHYHIHIIINPVNIHTLRMCRDNWRELGWQIAEWLQIMSNIPLQSFTYRDYHGQLVRGDETGIDLYKDKKVEKYGLQDRVKYLE